MSIDSIHDIHEQCHGGTVSLSVWNEVTANWRNLLLLKKFSTSGSRIQNQAYTCSTWFTEFCLQEIITLNFSVVKPSFVEEIWHQQRDLTFAAAETESQFPPARVNFPSPMRDRMSLGVSFGPFANGVCL